jgi:hypothetical protein
MHNRTKDNSTPLAAFTAKKAKIDAMLTRLAALSAIHFDAHPETLNWGNVVTSNSTPSN